MLILMLTLVCVSATPGSLRGKALVSFLDLNSPPEVSAAASEGAVSEGEAPCSLDKQGTDKEEPEPEEDEVENEEEEGDGEGAESEGREMDETPCAEESRSSGKMRPTRQRRERSWITTFQQCCVPPVGP